MDIFNKCFKAKLVPPYEVHLTMPSLSYTLLKDSEAFFQELKTTPAEYCERAHLGFDVAQNAILGNEARSSKTLILRFPEQLSTEHYCNPMAKGELICEFLPFATKNEWTDKDVSISQEVTQTHTIIFWKVALHEQEQRVVICAKSPEDELSKKLARKLKRMSL